MGPLKGVKVIEMAGIGPAPFCGMLLADMGADVIRVDRLTESGIGIPVPPKFDLLNRNKRSLGIDIKSEEGRSTLLDLIGKADVLIEGFRPGVMERLGLGPDDCLKVNPHLVYGRMTGWGQDGPLSQAAGHDINYIGLTGALAAIGKQGEAPTIPLNLIGDFAGGSLYLAMGVLAGVLAVRNGGAGQVVDAAVIDGTANLLSLIYSYRQAGFWSLDRGVNVIDGGAPFYDVFETLDGKYVTLGAVEGKFYREFLERAGIFNEELPPQNNPKSWPQLKKRFADLFKTKTRDQWCELLEGTDACFAPVLDMEECIVHSHNQQRGVYQSLDGVIHPAPAPRFSETASEIVRGASPSGADSREILYDWGLSSAQVDGLVAEGVISPGEG